MTIDTKRLPTEPGTVIYVETSDRGGLDPYILGKHGVWYPIAIGHRPYMSARRISEYTWREA